MEKRFFNVELRADETNENVTIIGHGAVFNTESNIGWFYERVEEGAFDEALKDSDVRALINHDPNLLLGRTKSKTLRLSTDAEGLRYEIDPPGTTYANDLIISLKRGDHDQSSYAFTLKRKGINGATENGDEWFEDDQGKLLRTIKKNGVERIYDVTIATFGAFPTADSGIQQNSEARESYERQTGKSVDTGRSIEDENRIAAAKAKKEKEERENVVTLESLIPEKNKDQFEIVEIDSRKMIAQKQQNSLSEDKGNDHLLDLLRVYK